MHALPRLSNTRGIIQWLSSCGYLAWRRPKSHICFRIECCACQYDITSACHPYLFQYTPRSDIRACMCCSRARCSSLTATGLTGHTLQQPIVLPRPHPQHHHGPVAMNAARHSYLVNMWVYPHQLGQAALLTTSHLVDATDIICRD